MTFPTIALQDSTPKNSCYGCGPANPEGIQIKSRWSEDGQFVIATVHLPPKYNAGVPGVMYGGAIASMIDCHSMWTAIAHAYRAEGREPGSDPLIKYVTVELNVKYLKPTLLDGPVHLKAWLEGDLGKRATVICELGPEGDVTAQGRTTGARVDWWE